jgi:hypothetical protein
VLNDAAGVLADGKTEVESSLESKLYLKISVDNIACTYDPFS